MVASWLCVARFRGFCLCRTPQRGRDPAVLLLQSAHHCSERLVPAHGRRLLKWTVTARSVDPLWRVPGLLFRSRLTGTLFGSPAMGFIH